MAITASLPKSRYAEYIPRLLTSLNGYNQKLFMHDALAGVTVGIVALPLALAFAIASGVSPDRGLFTAIVAGFLISALGGSRYQIGGPTGAFVAIVFDIVLRHGYEGLATATLMAGVLLILMGIFRFGSMIKFIPYPVTTGLTTGIALIIFTTQIRDFCGLKIEKLPGHTYDQWALYFAEAHTFSPASLTLALCSLGALIALRRWNPRVPGAIIVITCGAVVVQLLGISADSIETIGSRFNGIPNTLPSPSLPPFSWEKARLLVPEAIAIAILAAIESLLSAVVADGMTGDKHSSNGELVAQGFANLGSIVFGGIPATGAFARTATNIKSGARTPVAGIVHAATLFASMLLLAPYASMIPLPSLAAVLVLVAWNISELDHFRSILRAPRSDVLVLISTFLLTVLVDITVAVEVGVVMAALLFMKRMSEVANVVIDTPTLADAHPDQPLFHEPDALLTHDIPESVEVYEISGPLFFGIADRLKDTLNFIEQPPKAFVLRMRHVPVIDATGLHALEEFHHKCVRQKTVLILSGVREPVLRSLKNIGLWRQIGPENIHGHIDQAIARALEVVND